MSSFDERQRGEEAKFAHDASLRFKAEARRNKHLAHWASAEMGVTEGLVRINVGLEDIEDLREDIDQALSAAGF